VVVVAADVAADGEPAVDGPDSCAPKPVADDAVESAPPDV